ncbi:hypothetical protein DKX38_017492 [Salix brachista]|uniref:Trichome birefringence-like C-terminal domain-containing protein n=1 Tax=Salix brachista TaxID=2182728 RepID=A0A5N5KWQ8_9ROSI|nr:hypothetical protein DKX38_017492 [Salix brachista]
MLVGDSLSKNMWVSLTCLLHASVPNSSYTIDCTGLLSTFTMPEYGLSVLWLKNGFLVDVIYEKIGKVLKLDSIGTGSQWLGMDMLIFNTYHWWLHSGRSQTWDYFQVGDKIVKDMDRLEALKIALTTWATWIDHNTDPSKTKVYFQGVAAVHLDPKEWKDPDPSARTCMGQTKPVEGPKYPGPSHPGEAVVRSVISKMARPAYLLDITLLTQLRKDGHPATIRSTATELVPNSSYTIDCTGLLSTFTMPEYGLSVLWLKNGFLVDVIYEKIGKVLKLDSIGTGSQWLGMDMLIFNTYHWWLHSGRSQTWDYFQVGDKITKVYFQGVAAVHLDPKEWKDPDPSARTCMGQTKPVEGPKYPGPSHPGEAVVRSVISKMARPAYLLDITLLTQLRKDGHPGRYATKSLALNDCSHWCLAGVPDTWNQLLYAALLQN